MLWLNARPAPAVVVILPTQVATVDNSNAWQDVLEAGFGLNSTPLPTVAIPAQQFVAPTLALPTANTTPLAVEQASGNVLATPIPFDAGATPTLPAATAVAASGDAQVTAQIVTRPPQDWNPPALVPPISRDPLGRDHYWFGRPIDANATNYGLYYYPYGSDGPEQENAYRVHHGIDMPNPVGETVRAGGSGTVIWASDGLRVNDGVFQNSYSYGNVVLIQHDFGYRGQALYSLYAHLSAVLVQNGQYVRLGDPIGLVGQSGRVSGPHVHFEVRMGDNSYGSTYNPVLWMVPYVGTGVIAGRVLDVNGNWLQDEEITVRSFNSGLTVGVTTSYIFYDNIDDVNSDPEWNENFALGDIPAGRYEVVATIDGQRVSRVVNVEEGTTTFVELQPVLAATPQPPTPEAAAPAP
ncbi:MAG: peptidoglycan DD-metalloendopeptidase family protein [Chloroflexi bacterium]|nr:peptidoglycan DD-metalloendopeptidase family protein [Chloroflexota bacterium]